MMRRGIILIGSFVAIATVGCGSSSGLGCFRDQATDNATGGRDLDGAVIVDAAMTTERCVSECAARGFAYAGTQFSTQCFCGNSYGRSGRADNCDMECAGNSRQICGGSWANSVYSTKGAPTTPPPASDPAFTAWPHYASSNRAEGVVGVPFVAALQADCLAVGGWNTKVELATGALPPGLHFEPNGAIAGVPELAGDWNFTVRLVGLSCDGKTFPDSTLTVRILVTGSSVY